MRVIEPRGERRARSASDHEHVAAGTKVVPGNDWWHGDHVRYQSGAVTLCDKCGETLVVRRYGFTHRTWRIPAWWDIVPRLRVWAALRRGDLG